MTPAIPGKTRSQAGLCLLLIANLLVWSASWNVPSFHGGQFEQLGDVSPPFLVGAGDDFSDEDTGTGSTSSRYDAGTGTALTTTAVGVALAAGIRISSYPVQPQAPPALT